MGRVKKYEIQQVLEQLATVFVHHGFEASSLDDLERGTGLLRGSLYREFGSKQKMYEMALVESMKTRPKDDLTIDLIIIGLQELASSNNKIQKILFSWYQEQTEANICVPEVLGARLIDHSKILYAKDDRNE